MSIYKLGRWLSLHPLIMYHYLHLHQLKQEQTIQISPFRMEGIIRTELLRIKNERETANIKELIHFFKSRNKITVDKEGLIKRCSDIGLDYVS
jgi:hypothetical protein